jgi:hypothetical protein
MKPGPIQTDVCAYLDRAPGEAGNTVFARARKSQS